MTDEERFTLIQVLRELDLLGPREDLWDGIRRLINIEGKSISETARILTLSRHQVRRIALDNKHKAELRLVPM
jgi:DNA invertase Pin-like site-specific DNA recombinase